MPRAPTSAAAAMVGEEVDEEVDESSAALSCALLHAAIHSCSCLFCGDRCSFDGLVDNVMRGQKLIDRTQQVIPVSK